MLPCCLQAAAEGGLLHFRRVEAAVVALLRRKVAEGEELLLRRKVAEGEEVYHCCSLEAEMVVYY